MPFEPDKSTREHVLSTNAQIESRQQLLKSSTHFDVYINNKRYPPKELMRYAHQQFNGEKIWKLTGGKRTDQFLRKLGFSVKPKAYEAITNGFVRERPIPQKDLLACSLQKMTMCIWKFRGARSLISVLS